MSFSHGCTCWNMFPIYCKTANQIIWAIQVVWYQACSQSFSIWNSLDWTSKAGQDSRRFMAMHKDVPKTQPSLPKAITSMGSLQPQLLALPSWKLTGEATVEKIMHMMPQAKWDFGNRRAVTPCFCPRWKKLACRKFPLLKKIGNSCLTAATESIDFAEYLSLSRLWKYGLLPGESHFGQKFCSAQQVCHHFWLLCACA